MRSSDPSRDQVGGLSPGLLFKRRHGHRGGRDGERSPTYISWQSMIARCRRETHPFFEDYGGRGVAIDPRWLGEGGFECFLDDMGERPAGTSLDRIDVNGHYEPANCRWASNVLQRWNRRDFAIRSDHRDDKVPAPSFDSGQAGRPRYRRIAWDQEDDIPF